jgi:hypothetical protein
VGFVLLDIVACFDRIKKEEKKTMPTMKQKVIAVKTPLGNFAITGGVLI